jgi:hypothetical protein
VPVPDPDEVDYRAHARIDQKPHVRGDARVRHGPSGGARATMGRSADGVGQKNMGPIALNSG